MKYNKIHVFIPGIIKKDYSPESIRCIKNIFLVNSINEDMSKPFEHLYVFPHKHYKNFLIKIKDNNLDGKNFLKDTNIPISKYADLIELVHVPIKPYN